MSVQTAYNYFPQHGTPGGIVDVSPIAIETRIVEENSGVIFPGMGVVQGTTAGTEIKLPTGSTTVDKFEGVAINRRTTEHGLEGDLLIRKGTAIGVASWGKFYVRVTSTATPAYGEPVYLVTSGTDAGCFTDSSSSTLAINARFIGAKDGNAAPIELFNASATASEYVLPAASASTLGGIKVGTGLSVTSDGTLSVSGS